MELREALAKMNPLDDAQWNTDGTAKLAAVRVIVGNQAITRDDIAKIAPEFSKNNPFIPEQVREENTQALGELIEEAKKNLDDARVRLAIAQRECEDYTRKLDHFLTENAKINPAPSSAQTIQGYLKRQRQDLIEKGERMKRIKESGVDLQALAGLMK
jgi:hypothetical protein